MDEAKSRVLSRWIQEEAISKFRESQEMLESRLMSMRWVQTWKPSDEHPQDRKAKARDVLLGHKHPEVVEVEVESSTSSKLGRNAHASMGIVQSC